MKKIILLFLLLGLSFFFVNCVEGNVDVNSPEYQEVLAEFNNSEWVRVIVDLNYKGSINNTISFLSNDEVRFKREMMFSNGFVAEITKEGLDKLVNITDVDKISFDMVAYTTDSEGNIIDKNEEIIDSKNRTILLWFLIIFAFIVSFFIMIKKKNKKRG